MAGIAKITLIGNLGRDPQTSYTPNGRMCVQFSIAVGRRWNDTGGNLQEKTDWYRVECWGRTAETMDKLTQQGALTKGKQVFVAGDLKPREYQAADGTTRMSLDVTAETIQLLGSREPQDAPRMDVADMDSVPF